MPDAPSALAQARQYLTARHPDVYAKYRPDFDAALDDLNARDPSGMSLLPVVLDAMAVYTRGQHIDDERAAAKAEADAAAKAQLEKLGYLGQTELSPFLKQKLEGVTAPGGVPNVVDEFARFVQSGDQTPPPHVRQQLDKVLAGKRAPADYDEHGNYRLGYTGDAP